MEPSERLEQLYEHLKAAGLYEDTEVRTNGTNGHITVTDANRYAIGAYSKEIQALQQCPEGDRNNQLNTSAFNLFQLVKANELDKSSVEQTLWSVALTIGLKDSEIRGTLRSAYEAAEARTITVEPRRTIESAEVFELGSMAEQAEPGILQPLKWTDIENLSSDVDWLIPDLFERGRLYALYAAAKTGKSLFVQYLVAQLVQSGVKVMYLDYENSHQDLKDRFFTSMRLTSDELENLLYFSFPAIGPLDTFSGAATLHSIVEHYKPELIIYDTTARMVKESEQDSDTFKSLYRLTHVWVKKLGITQVRIDHAGKDETKGQRGASGKNDDVDAVLRLQKVVEFPEVTRFMLHCELQRSGHHEPKVPFLMHRDPLRFIREDQNLEYEPIVEFTVNQWLDKWGCPNDISNPKAKDEFKSRNIKIPGGNNKLAEELQERKRRVDPSQETLS